MFKNEEGFSLLELVVAVGVAGIIAAVALPTFAGIQGTARTTSATYAASASAAEAAALAAVSAVDNGSSSSSSSAPTVSALNTINWAIDSEPTSTWFAWMTYYGKYQVHINKVSLAKAATLANNYTHVTINGTAYQLNNFYVSYNSIDADIILEVAYFPVNSGENFVFAGGTVGDNTVSFQSNK